MTDSTPDPLDPADWPNLTHEERVNIAQSRVKLAEMDLFQTVLNLQEVEGSGIPDEETRIDTLNSQVVETTARREKATEVLDALIAESA